MIDIPLFWQYQIILAAHFLADFKLQTHWQASNKSKSNWALLEHVAVYSVVLGLVTGVLFNFGALWFSFLWINTVLHFVTDYVTSRWSQRHFRPAVHDSWRVINFVQSYDREPSPYDLERLRLNPGKNWHSFFEVIGFDQWIHVITLATTLWLIVA